MKRPLLFAALMALVTAGAAVPRLARLGNRPMHCDEAVHAIKFGRLLERDDYVYDPREYHGPSLNFLTLPLARLASAEKLSEVTEALLRLLPAIFGILLVGLVWLVRDELGRGAAFCAAVLTAVSPAMVFYSRYYIQEMLLVCFTFAAMVALWRWARLAGAAARGESTRDRFSRARQAFWLVLLGLCLGLMHATKETCVIALFAMALAAALGMAELRAVDPKRLLLSGLVVLLTAAGVSALLFSSLLDNPRGILDSYTTYFYYLGRASGEGSVGRHVYPWHYYLRLLFWYHRADGLLWTEPVIAALALVGLAAASGKRLSPVHPPLARFLAVYTVILAVVYSAMPYKTPWCALGFLHGMILLGGVGASALVRLAPGYFGKAAVVALLAAATCYPAWQAYRTSFVAYEHPANPYVYAHTTGDVPLLARRVRQIAAVRPDAREMHVQVVCPEDDYWPLPWYLRGFRRVGWFSDVPRGPAAPLIITQPPMEPLLLEYLYEVQPPGQRSLYVPVYPDNGRRDWQLRPNVPLRLYVRLDLHEAYTPSRQEDVSAEGAPAKTSPAP